MKTVSFTATCGVNAGYNESNSNAKQGVAQVAWQQAAEEVYASSGVYVSAIITEAKVIYSKNWGCPVGGEAIIIIQGELNPEFATEKKYKEGVIQTLQKLKEELGQTTAQVVFHEVEMEYLK
jgi:hypothetical protein